MLTIGVLLFLPDPLLYLDNIDTYLMFSYIPHLCVIVLLHDFMIHCYIDLPSSACIST